MFIEFDIFISMQNYNLKNSKMYLNLNEIFLIILILNVKK